MSTTCCPPPPTQQLHDKRYRRVLWTVLGINAALFFIEAIAGLTAGSTSLQADALDVRADAAHYGTSLFVVGMSLHHRAGAALAKGVTMGLFGLWIPAASMWHAAHGTVPAAVTMGTVGFVAILVNAASFALLWACRAGDSNMRSVWLCSRNDFVGNCAVLLAALGVFGTGAVVASIMGALALQSAWHVVLQARLELRGI